MGPLFCLLSAVAFGAMAVFGKLSYDAGVSVDALLLVRFGLASGVLLVVMSTTARWRGIARRDALVGLGMGAIGYAAQATFYFSALRRLDASLVALIFYVYPVLVMAVAVALGRERSSAGRVIALATALAGIGLVLAGASAGSFDVIGALLALGSALTYTGYIMVGDRLTAAMPPLGLTALVCTGACGTFLVAGIARGGTALRFEPIGWAWLGALAVVSTVGAILLFFAGLARVGPSKAAILSILEPVVTAASAAMVFGETLSAVQWMGGMLVLLAVLLVQLRDRDDNQPAPQQQVIGREARSGASQHQAHLHGVKH